VKVCCNPSTASLGFVSPVGSPKKICLSNTISSFFILIA
jgi:hypothetical protein